MFTRRYDIWLMWLNTSKLPIWEWFIPAITQTFLIGSSCETPFRPLDPALEVLEFLRFGERSCDSNLGNGRCRRGNGGFLQWGVPHGTPKSSIYSWIFHYKPSSYGGNPQLRKPDSTDYGGILLVCLDGRVVLWGEVDLDTLCQMFAKS